MRIPAVLFLACALVAGPRLCAAPGAQLSRVENQSTLQAWKVAMGGWVAGKIRIRDTERGTELASLKAEGEAYFLMPGKKIDLEVLPTRNCLALQVTFSMPAGTGSAGSVFISQGNPGDPHTLNINSSHSVQVFREHYGHARKGPFVLLN